MSEAFKVFIRIKKKTTKKENNMAATNAEQPRNEETK